MFRDLPAELQEEELEVMKSIYEGDELYSSPKDNRHLYKFGEDTASRSFILGEKKSNYFRCETANYIFTFSEISWGPSYPSELPDINLDSFYNKHVLAPVKEGIIKAVKGDRKKGKIRGKYKKF